MNAKKSDGYIDPLVKTACQGVSIIFEYQPYNPGIPTSIPQSYQWMHDQTVLTGETNKTITVSTQGSYWLSVLDSNGCKTNINQNPASAIFIKALVPIIEGPTNICADDVFTLNGYVGGNAGYQWTENGITGSQWFGLPEISPSIGGGTQAYTVTASVSDGGGGTCPAQSAPHNVTANYPPDEPVLNYFIDCDNYQVSLMVNDPQSEGVYNWSNGQTGAVVPAIDGGPYMVRYTSPGGCSETSQIVVPKNPEDYLWIFPTGCYTICKGFETQNHYLIGPDEEFKEWLWISDGVTELTGHDTKPQPYPIIHTGEFQLILDNGWCGRVSGVMDFSEEDCEDCSETIRIRREGEIEKIRDENGNCYYRFNLNITNPYSYNIFITITGPAGNGIFDPSSITVPPGGTFPFTINMYPLNGFTGGGVRVVFDVRSEEDNPCQQSTEIDFPELCSTGSMRMQAVAGHGLSDLQLVPNPAKGQTQILYKYGSDQVNAERSIVIYDMIGRFIERIVVHENSGTVPLSVERYPSGYYVVLLKEGNNLIQQQKMMVK